MQVRLRNIRKLRQDEYRMTLDLIDPARGPWEQGDCVVQVDLLDAPGQHYSTARGLVKPALEQYRMAPNEPPTTSEARLLWDMGEAVNYYIDRIFEAGLLCPSGPQAKDDDGRIVYLTPGLKATLAGQLERVKLLERRLGRIVPYVFPHRGKGRRAGQPRRDFRKAWLRAARA